ncbi:exodeoxyribonuclease V subunit alpha [Oxalobacter paraformigenes]|uniref:RecBCD enzyme subunit RecD n=1 Tax=Oxalobacter paraformigenes TaxID=556268 RepID=C3X2X3_9BURK|nr:exodeoxyribonuclease V subunit alpha [Oxalobacter paraformigenes]EEO27559.1 exodeoxyribonuclease V, alpha subunit [Oxalobacter paraformigenes]
MKQAVFSETPEQTLARAFSEYVLAWARESRGKKAASPLDRPGEALLKEAAYRVSLAVSSGNACLALAELAGSGEGVSPESIRETLLASGVVAEAADPGNAPLILDGDERLYLHRYFDYERALAECIAARNVPGKVDAALIRPLLDILFPSGKGKPFDWQKAAVALALREPFLIVSGGPGTGKTTTVASLLACLLETDPENRIVLAAPTGKAAMRMLEAISQRSSLFPLHMQPLIPKEARTVHRLLGMTGDRGSVRFHATNPLPLDTLIVDEASMLDLAMASRLFAALPAHARVILLGDKDQLAAVEAGSVFSELSGKRVFSEACLADLEKLTGLRPPPSLSSPSGQATPLENRVVWLTRNYRFSEDSGIGKLAADIRMRRSEEALDFLCSGKDASVVWFDTADTEVASRLETTLVTAYRDYFDCLENHPHDPVRVFRAFSRFRILCAVREGPCGVKAVNRLIAAHLSKTGRAGQSASADWFAGRPVMIRRNDYALRLFNGDVGIALPDASGRLAVFFPKEDGTFRALSPSRLGEHETSFAMTVHQSQGSEFDSVALLLPAQFSRVLCRELVYTGITRAREKIAVMAPKTVLAESLKNNAVRHSGLPERLREAIRKGKPAFLHSA